MEKNHKHEIPESGALNTKSINRNFFTPKKSITSISQKFSLPEFPLVFYELITILHKILLGIS